MNDPRLERKSRSRNIAFGLALILIGALLAWLLLPRPAPEPAPAPAPPQAAAPAEPPALPEGDRLAAAVKAAFPRGPAVADENGARYTFENSRLIDTPSGPVLVSEGAADDGAHASAGRLDIFYLKAAGAGFAVAKAYPKAVEIGSFGRMREWGVSNAFGPLPVVSAEGGFTGQGYTCGFVILTELAPGGPRRVAGVQIVSDNSGAMTDEPATSIEGKIANPTPQGFDVVYTGTTTFTERWRRVDAEFVGPRESRVPEC